MEDDTDVEETPDAKMEAIDTLKKLKNNKPQNGAKSDITRLQMKCCEQKIKLHTTRYGNIVKESRQNLQIKKYHKCGHIHGSAKCCKTKFTQIGQTQNFKLNQMTRYGNVSHWSKDTFSTHMRTSEEFKELKCQRIH